MRLIARFLVVGALVGALVVALSMYLDAPPPAALPEDLKQALHMLPTDIESVAGSLKPFVLARREKEGNWFTRPNAVLTFDAILDLNLANIRQAGAFRDALDSVRGREALWAVAGKREQEVQRERQTSLIVLGVHPYESITIIKFAAALPVTLEPALRHVSTVSLLPNGAKVFRATAANAAAVIPRPDLLIVVSMIGTEDAMLKSLIERLATPGGRMAFDDADRAWSLTDLEASVWVLRRTIRGGKPGRREDGTGRDWAVFAYRESLPSQALFRSVKARWPWRGEIAEVRTDREPVNPPRISWGGGYADTRSVCAPGTGIQCFGFSFAVEALGVMIWM